MFSLFAREVKDNRNFLGCMRNVGFGSKNAIPQDLSAGVLVGISTGCKDSVSVLCCLHASLFMLVVRLSACFPIHVGGPCPQ